jgi:hypothetical protein
MINVAMFDSLDKPSAVSHQFSTISLLLTAEG